MTIPSVPRRRIRHSHCFGPQVESHRSAQTAQVLRLLVVAASLVVVSLQAQITTGKIETVAGTGASGYSNTGSASTSQIDAAYSLAVDDAGNLFIADSWNHRIRKVTPQGSMTEVSGTGSSGSSGDNGPAINASLSYPRAIAIDAVGNAYFSDSGNNRIRKIGINGVITRYAGNGTGSSGDGGNALSASFRIPRGLAISPSGELYIADGFNSRIRKITAGGTVSTFAGTGFPGHSGDGGPALAANIGFVHSLAFDSDGRLYFSDTSCHCIRRVSVNGMIETIAGSGTRGFSGDGGPAVLAQLNAPRGLTVDTAGALYIADSHNHRIRRVSTTGMITTVVGTGTPGYSGDPGTANTALLNLPYDLASDREGNLYIADLSNYRIRKVRLASNGNPGSKPTITQQSVVNAASFLPSISSGGLISVFGTGLSVDEAAAETLPLPTSLAGVSVIVNGKSAPLIYVSPGQINAQLPWGLTSPIALKVQVLGVESPGVNVPILTASPGIFTYGQGRAVILNGDYSLNTPQNAATPGETVLIYATGLGRVTPVLKDGFPAQGPPSGSLSHTAGNTSVLIGGEAASVSFSGLAPGYAGLWQVNAVVPQNVAQNSSVPLKVIVDGAESNAAMISIASAASSGSTTHLISTYAGNGSATSSGDGGPATSAGFYLPFGVAVDAGGNVYIAELFGNRVRKVSPNGVISTFAGTGVGGYSGEGGPAAAAQIFQPAGLAVDRAGNLYIAEVAGHRIRKVTPDGIITTFAGGGSGGDGPATQALVNAPAGLAFDSQGNLFVAETGSGLVRKITPDGILSTVIDGLDRPDNVAIDLAGNIYVAEFTVVQRFDTSGLLTPFFRKLRPFVAADRFGNVYLSDYNTGQVLKSAGAGALTTIAGTGIGGFSGDGGLATQAQLAGVRAMAFGAAGEIYIAEAFNNRVRKLTPGSAASPTNSPNLGDPETSSFALDLAPSAETSTTTCDSSTCR